MVNVTLLAGDQVGNFCLLCLWDYRYNSLIAWCGYILIEQTQALIETLNPEYLRVQGTGLRSFRNFAGFVILNWNCLKLAVSNLREVCLLERVDQAHDGRCVST